MDNGITEHQEELQQIKQMMERSSRFISLSGLSGISAGTCALVGAYFARAVLNNPDGNVLEKLDSSVYNVSVNNTLSLVNLLENKLIEIAIITFIVAFASSFLFTFLRSRATKVSVWSATSKRLFINLCIPLIAGGFFLLKLIQYGVVGLIAPGCLIFYGLALVNAAKYTLGEVRYLGYFQIALGIFNLWFVGKGLFFWATGFGLLHIIYGIIMWYKYEKG
jgi:hypothetical protein